MSYITHSLVAAVAATLAVPAFAAAAPTIITSGHFDFEVAYLPDEGWEPHWHDHDAEEGAPGAELDFADVVMTGVFDSTDVNDTPFVRPASWAFAGPAGSTLYVFPAIDTEPELPYIGLASEETPTGVFVNNQIRLTFKGIQSGPTGGEFSVYTFAGADPNALFSSVDAGLTSANNTATLNAGSHVHYNWAFSEIGTYELIFEASGDLVGGGTTSSGDFVATFQVIPEPASLAVLGLGCLTLLRRRR